MQQTETTAKKTAPKTGERILKKVSVDIIKLADKKVGEFIEGVYETRTTGPWIDKQTGEESELVRLHFTRDDGTKFVTFEDGGLRNAMANAGVKPGDFIRIVKLEKVALGGGRSANNYDIFMD